MIKSVRYNDSLLHKENSVNTRYIKSKLLDVVSKYFPNVKTDDFFKTYIGFGDDYRIDISCEYQSDYKQGYGKYWVGLTKDFKQGIKWVGYGKEQFNNDLPDIEQTIKSLTTVNSSKQIKSSPNFKEFTADEIFDTFDTEGLTDTVFMDREQCKANKCGMDEFTELMWNVAPTWLGIHNPDDVREVCRRAKNPKAKAFLEAFETALENAKFVDRFYDSIAVHKKGEIASSSWKELMDDSDWDYGNPESYEVWDDNFEVSFRNPDKQKAEEFYNTHPESLYLIEYLEHGNRIIKSKENNMIKSSYEDTFTVHPWDTNQVTGTSDEDLGLSYVVEAYGNEFVNVDDETLNDIRDNVLLRYFDDDAYVRDWNINYPDNQIESIYDIEDPEDLNNEELARYFDYEAYGRDIRLERNMVWDSEEECWVSAHDVDDSELDNDKYIFMRG